VKLFEYITEDDLKDLTPRPPAEQPKDAPNKDTAK